MSGYLRTAVLLAGMTAIFVGVGFMLGGQQGMVIAFLVACGMNVFAWWNSDRMLLRMHNAQPIGPGDAPRLFQMTQQLATNAGLPMPALYVIHEDQPNAFATGRSPDRAAVALNTGLLDMMPEREVAGVIAHELAHIRNRDTLIMTMTATIAGAIGMLAQFGFLFGRGDNRQNPFGLIGTIAMMVLAPIAAMIVQMAISRSREYEADRVGAKIAGDPEGLASALMRLESYKEGRVNQAAEANPATAHMFIINPLSGLRMDGLFSTHPKTANRVAALRALGGGAGRPPSRPMPVAPPAAGPWSKPPAGPRRNPWG
ncbi:MULTISPECIES: zinc metalloprotease HtpX [Roseomonadaceae]|uniref:Protease HtpX homolog n=1 Tax=Falsiroseomonas oleicola TaxID=2801474 RepID=A0ABS6H763_9PROT|nr:zinc metalloprotease HtpX [Roseomonas oleicola]MBU8543326.1 zinc metalloprotease HtpX [Roseomonas oleicola]